MVTLLICFYGRFILNPIPTSAFLPQLLKCPLSTERQGFDSLLYREDSNIMALSVTRIKIHFIILPMNAEFGKAFV